MQRKNSGPHCKSDWVDILNYIINTLGTHMDAVSVLLR